ncbi:MAG: c-type cytochrome [Gemmatimonadaceae bacterium]
MFRLRSFLAALFVVLVGVLLSSLSLHAQQATVSAPDIARGRVLFESQCARCHGIDGSGGMGANLRRPRLRRAPDDSTLAALIQSGIPERGMPDMWQISPREAGFVAAYVRTLGHAASEGPLPGNAERGRALFVEKGRCQSCHMVNGIGGSLGPDLSEVGAARSSAYLRRALVRPGEELPAGAPPGYAMGGEYAKWLPVRAVMRDGKEVRGVRLNEDAFTIQLRDFGNRIHSLDKSSLRSFERLTGSSAMRSYESTFSPAELDDVIAYLAGLQGRP